MYNRFFGFRRSPFELSPDPHFFFPLEKSKEALASIYYALCQRKGFVVLTGEVGTGKTLVIRCLLDLLKRQQIPFANIFNPRLSIIDFLTYVNFDLGIKVTDRSKSSLLRGLYTFLLMQLQQGLTTVLVVDEAQQMSFDVLEEIRLLANLETSQHKLIQIVLVGQPEFDTKLDSFELRQLKQRVAIRCRLEPYTITETLQYIEQRLKRVGGAGSMAGAIFPIESVEAIHRYSQGIPRLINSICDQSLIAAYARQWRSVPVELIDEVASYFRLHFVPEPAKSTETPDFTGQREAANYLLRVIESNKSKPAASIHRVRFP